MSKAKLAKMILEGAKKKPKVTKKTIAKGSSKSDFNSDINKVRKMALTPAARNKKLIEVYKKYGRKAPISLVKPVGKKKGGKVSGAPHNRLY